MNSTPSFEELHRYARHTPHREEEHSNPWAFLVHNSMPTASYVIDNQAKVCGATAVGQGG
jgi:hypothetical protein